jgi:ATP-dependent Lon protease
MAPYKPPAPDVARALAKLPLLVDPQIVVFPRLRVQIVVREPRQLQLVSDALGTHRAVGIVQPAESAAEGAESAELCEIGAVGTIVDAIPISGGRGQLAVIGRGRVKLSALVSAGPCPYRRAMATVLPSLDTAVTPGELTALHQAAARFASIMNKRDPSFRYRIPDDPDAGFVADHAAHAMLIDPRHRQAILETLDVRERVLRVAELLLLQASALDEDRRSGPAGLN